MLYITDLGCTTYADVTIYQLGGNAPFKEFLKSYPAEGGYTEGMEMNPKYHSWAASQYREKVRSINELSPLFILRIPEY